MVKNSIEGSRWTPPIDIIDDDFTTLQLYVLF